ncbi:MAG: GAF domain-containing protein [Elainellaceae cyanobacterium]
MTSAQQLKQLAVAASDPDTALTNAMELLCQLLACDRCFLYLRDPDTRQGRVTHCYSIDIRWADLRGAAWIESDNIETKDPLMAIAFRTAEPVFVEDIETASADVINLDYERKEFGHRALVHAPIYGDGRLIGILEPCMFEQPREWTEADRELVAIAQEALTPIVLSYLESTAIADPIP